MPERVVPDAVRAQTPPADASPVDQKAVQPPNEAERRKLRLEKTLGESDDVRSKRRHEELHVQHKAHLENVAEAHEMFPAPVGRHDEYGRTWEDWPDEVKTNWNERSKMIASANRAYHLAVRRTFEEHQAEDAHIRRELAKKAENA